MEIENEYKSFKQKLVNIANAIREKKGIKRKLTLNDMPKILEKDEKVITLFSDEASLAIDEKINSILTQGNVTGGQGWLDDVDVSFENFPDAKYLIDWSLGNDFDIKTLHCGTIEVIGKSACRNSVNIETVNAPNVKKIETEAFYTNQGMSYVPKMTSFNAPLCKEFGDYALYSREGSYRKFLSELNIESAEKIGASAFHNVWFTNLYVPHLKEIGTYAFFNNTKLERIHAPELRVLPQYSFSQCTALIEATFPKVEEIQNSAFYNSSNLTRIHLPNARSIDPGAFGMTNLKELYLENPYSVCKLNYQWNNFTLKVFVPKHLIKKYEKDEYWGRLNILPISEE